MKIHSHSEWKDTFGGPFLLASAHACLSWSGAVDEQKGDYWEACTWLNERSPRYMETFQREENVILFADEPYSTKVVDCDTGYVFVGWVYGDEEDFPVIDLLGSVQLEQLEQKEETRVNVKAGSYFFLDAALPGTTDEKYEVVFRHDVTMAKTCFYEPQGLQGKYRFRLTFFGYG